MVKTPIFDAATLKEVCDVLARTEGGLTNAEIDQLLAQCRVPNVAPSLSKRDRLYNALASVLNETHNHMYVIAFIQKAMKPVRYATAPGLFEARRDELNVALAFVGVRLWDDGRLGWIEKANTLTEAQERAGRLRHALESRKVHADVLVFCQAELLQENYFHAVFEATKSVADKIRDKTGLTYDGAELATRAFSIGGTGTPTLAINALATETDRSEQKGFMNLIVGLFGMFRNRLAHTPRISWPIDESDALDILSIVSLVHRKLDCTTRHDSRPGGAG